MTYRIGTSRNQRTYNEEKYTHKNAEKRYISKMRYRTKRERVVQSFSVGEYSIINLNHLK